MRTSSLLLSLMIVASVLAVVMRPSQTMADHRKKFDLELMIPKKFGEWQEEKQSFTQVVNPQQKELIDRLYSQTLSRSYRNDEGYRIMLSIAYGGNQTEEFQMHTPELCYPAQGFVVNSKTTDALDAGGTHIPIIRMYARLGQRHEPITYWTTVGDRAVKNGVHKKLIEMSYTLTGKIPDGMLVRVSSLDEDPQRAYGYHDKFIHQMISSMAPDERARLVGTLDQPAGNT